MHCVSVRLLRKLFFSSGRLEVLWTPKEARTRRRSLRIRAKIAIESKWGGVGREEDLSSSSRHIHLHVSAPNGLLSDSSPEDLFDLSIHRRVSHIYHCPINHTAAAGPSLLRSSTLRVTTDPLPASPSLYPSFPAVFLVEARHLMPKSPPRPVPP